MRFERSHHDQCLFMHKQKKMTLLLHTDNCLLFCETDEMLKEMILTMQKIFKTTEWEDLKGDKTPARETPMGADLQGKPFQEEWECASVVGMLMFLVNTRPDTQFAVHQCDFFTHSPKNSHKFAVKRVIRHLKHTQENGKDRGLTFELGGNEIPKIECCADADFTGLWNVENNEDPVSSRSRTGFVIFVGNCPVIWQSKSQGETSLSTTEADIIALSMSMRELPWSRRMVVDVAMTLEADVQNPV